MPYLLLVVFVLVWGTPSIKAQLHKIGTIDIPWPGLHNVIQRMPPVTNAAAPYAATFRFDIIAAAGTSCILASFLASLLLGMSPLKFISIFFSVGKQMSKALLTISTVLGLAYLMNYCGATSTLGLAFAATGTVFPFFSALLGWLGVFLTGSDTSANALFGNLQEVTAGGQFSRRSDGQNDQCAEHCGSCGRHWHETRGRGAPVPLHAKAQYLPGQRSGPGQHVLRAYRRRKALAGSGAEEGAVATFSIILSRANEAGIVRGKGGAQA